MAFTGKATYSAGAALPEIAEDVSDIVSIVSPYETPLLDQLGNAPRPAASTYHEWLEDELLPNTDSINQATIANPTTDTTFVVAHADRFRVGDQVRPVGSTELWLVTASDTTGGTITVVRNYGGTTAAAVANAQALSILGNAALEGDDAPQARFTNRTRNGNWTQIFTAAVRVSGSDVALRKLAVSDELDYQKQERLRELLRDLENTVINGASQGAAPQGSGTVRRTMRGVIPSLTTNVFKPNVDGFPTDVDLTETQLNLALRLIWEQTSSRIDTIVVNGYQKRRINNFITASRKFDGSDVAYRDLVSVYESDFGVCRVVLCRSVPANTVLLLDSSRVDVLPLAGRSFHYKPLASAGDYEAGEVIGEYTLELRNQNAHGIITGLDVASASPRFRVAPNLGRHPGLAVPRTGRRGAGRVPRRLHTLLTINGSHARDPPRTPLQKGTWAAGIPGHHLRTRRPRMATAQDRIPSQENILTRSNHERVLSRSRPAGPGTRDLPGRKFCHATDDRRERRRVAGHDVHIRRE
jgi:hypothetical protein